MDKKLNIAFVWHMHQPLYKDPFTGEYIMPWVLLHATKDYYDMAAILDEFPDVHQTFNLVPCLIEQINDYCDPSVRDTYRILSLKKPEDLTRTDKLFLLTNFFQSNWDNMIRPVPRYWELLRKRGISSSAEDIAPVLRYFRDEDYLDLQVLFNLSWIDPSIRERDGFLTHLMKKGRGYTGQEKHALLDKQIEIARQVLPKYRELQDKGIIEVSTSPYYHPILPLLVDSYSAKVAMPEAAMPKVQFAHPEDANAQLIRAAELYRETFHGAAPRGMWPSEGSVSMDILPHVKAAGIEWLATDEEILTNSLKRAFRRDASGNPLDTFLYKPYAINAGTEKLTIIFRDHVLSDLIGFDYAKMSPHDAVDDFISRLLHIYNGFEDPENHIVPVILDGENAWENYRNDGRDFLRALYSRLSGHPKLRCTTVSEFLSLTTKREELAWLYPGSWISHNFKIWIGHQEDNAAWDSISDARAALVKHEQYLGHGTAAPQGTQAIDAAWREIYAAQGSDWFWWYGDEHSSLCDEHFDSLFRNHLKKVYTLIGKEPPVSLDIPISTEEKGFKPAVLPAAYINPVIDGEITNYFEWLAAGRLQRVYYGTAMHREMHSGGIIDGISFGFSKDSLFFRFDYGEKYTGHDKEWRLAIHFIHPAHLRIDAVIKGNASTATVFRKTAGEENWEVSGQLKRIASDRVVELGISLDEIGAQESAELRLVINIDAGDEGMERWPVKGFLILDVPAPDFEQENWVV